jgi:phosphate-selective porin OprO/OprP
MILAKAGLNYTRATSFDNALAEFHFLHNTEPGFTSPGDPASPPYSNCIAASNEITAGRFGLTTELFWGDGALGRPDIYGLTAMPTWFLTEKLQLVTTFQLAGSHEENGILLPLRYEALSPGAGDKSGDAYFAGYGGLDYYLYGHKLKLMSGVKYTYLDGNSGGGDFNGWTFMAGLRMAF